MTAKLNEYFTTVCCDTCGEECPKARTYGSMTSHWAMNTAILEAESQGWRDGRKWICPQCRCKRDELNEAIDREFAFIP